jgi:predicted nuclease with TOPRIM domain
MFLQGLTEAMVIANQCMLWEDGLVKLKNQLLEAAEANQTLMSVANELTQEKDRMENELASLKGDMTAKDAKLEKALDENKRVAERLQVMIDKWRRSRPRRWKSSSHRRHMTTIIPSTSLLALNC